MTSCGKFELERHIFSCIKNQTGTFDSCDASFHRSQRKRKCQRFFFSSLLTLQLTAVDDFPVCFSWVTSPVCIPKHSPETRKPMPDRQTNVAELALFMKGLSTTEAFQV